MNKSLKKVLALLMTVAMIAALGVSAFAESPKPSGKTEWSSTSKPEKDPVDEDEDEEWDDFYDDYMNGFSSYDMSEFFETIEDEATREKLESLYDEYMQAYLEEQKAEEKLQNAEDAFLDALEDVNYGDVDLPTAGNDGRVPSKENSDKNTDDDNMSGMEDMDIEDILNLFMEFISWYNSSSNPSADEEEAEPTPTPSAQPTTPAVSPTPTARPHSSSM